MKDFSSIARLLRHGNAYASYDRITFRRFQLNQISLQRCIRDFRDNNSIPIYEKIDEELFLEWVKSLGY